MSRSRNQHKKCWHFGKEYLKESYHSTLRNQEKQLLQGNLEPEDIDDQVFPTHKTHSSDIWEWD